MNNVLREFGIVWEEGLWVVRMFLDLILLLRMKRRRLWGILVVSGVGSLCRMIRESSGDLAEN
jgi:hypothetical protein